MASGETPADERLDMTDTTTPAEFVKLRDQLRLDLSALLGDPLQLRSAEYLLASGLVPLSTIRARYDETHPAPEGESTEHEVKTWAPGEGIEVGAFVEYVGEHFRTKTPALMGMRGQVVKLRGNVAEIPGVGMGLLLDNLRRIR